MAVPVRTVLAAVFASLLISVFAGCKPSGNGGVKRSPRLVVFAASSLRDVFTAIGADWKKRHAGADVVFNFSGTHELRTQLEQGATADVFAAADMLHMEALQKAGAVVTPVVFARNELVLVVSAEARKTVSGLADLPKVGRIVLGVPEVPIGHYALRILDRANEMLGADFRARVEAKVVSRELNVRQALNKVRLGESDAAFVYRSDVAAEGDRLGVVVIPPELNVVADYPIAVVKNAVDVELARGFVAQVLSDGGQGILQKAGFLARGVSP